MNIIHFSKKGEFSKEIPRDAKDVVIAIDSQSISVHQVMLPKMSNAKVVKAIPYALESHLLDDINLLKFVVIKSPIQSTWDVFVVSKEILHTIENHLLKAKCKPTAILPDFMLLPFSEGSVNYHEKDDFITFRNDVNQGGCIDSKIFHRLFTDSNLVKANFSYSTKVKVNIQTSIAQKGLSEYINPWRIPAALALIALLIASAQIWASNNQLNELLSQQKINNEKQFSSLFPKVERIVNIRVQTKQKLSDIAQQDSVYQNDLLGKLSSDILPNSKARKITFDNQILTLEISK
jgi:type II secretory pathway component PulL